MQHVNNLLPAADQNGPTKPSSTTSPRSTPEQRKTLAMVWTVLYNRKLVTDPPGSTAHRQFEHDMQDLREPALLRGLERARDFVGFFTTPTFRELCRMTPADFGLPDAITAMREACTAPYPKDAQRYSHPAVYLAGCAVGWFDMQNRTERELLPLFEHAYTVLCRRVMDGEQLDMPVRKALPAQVHVPASPEQAQAHLSRLKAMLGGASEEATP